MEVLIYLWKTLTFQCNIILRGDWYGEYKKRPYENICVG